MFTSRPAWITTAFFSFHALSSSRCDLRSFDRFMWGQLPPGGFFSARRIFGIIYSQR
jgi:hypothetical protein